MREADFGEEQIMERLRQFVQSHKAVAYGLVFGMVLFFNCCGFPIYNLNKEWPFSITAEYLLSLIHI